MKTLPHFFDLANPEIRDALDTMKRALESVLPAAAFAECERVALQLGASPEGACWSTALNTPRTYRGRCLPQSCGAAAHIKGNLSRGSRPQWANRRAAGSGCGSRRAGYPSARIQHCFGLQPKRHARTS